MCAIFYLYKNNFSSLNNLPKSLFSPSQRWGDGTVVLYSTFQEGKDLIRLTCHLPLCLGQCLAHSNPELIFLEPVSVIVRGGGFGLCLYFVDNPGP